MQEDKNGLIKSMDNLVKYKIIKIDMWNPAE